jgi:hypothetical protein
MRSSSTNKAGKLQYDLYGFLDEKPKTKKNQNFFQARPTLQFLIKS